MSVTGFSELDRKVLMLEQKLNYSFKNKQLAGEALTHSSFCNEHKKQNKKPPESNERLEFLGDSVLSLMTCEYLFANFDENEGVLTKLKAALVCEDSLYDFAQKIGLGECIVFGRSNIVRKAPLADAVEAVLGALYLDSGFEEAKKLIMPYIIECANKSNLLHDYKSALQELVQKNKGELLSYEIVGESGPDHDKRFECNVKINSNVIACGIGRSKKDAEQEAAKKALELMGMKE